MDFQTPHPALVAFWYKDCVLKHCFLEHIIVWFSMDFQSPYPAFGTQHSVWFSMDFQAPDPAFGTVAFWAQRLRSETPSAFLELRNGILSKKTRFWNILTLTSWSCVWNSLSQPIQEQCVSTKSGSSLTPCSPPALVLAPEVIESKCLICWLTGCRSTWRDLYFWMLLRSERQSLRGRQSREVNSRWKKFLKSVLKSRNCKSIVEWSKYHNSWWLAQFCNYFKWLRFVWCRLYLLKSWIQFALHLNIFWVLSDKVLGGLVTFKTSW